MTIPATGTSGAFAGPYRIEPVHGGVAVYWHDAPPNISKAIRLFATTDEARRWIAERNLGTDGA